MLLTLRGTGRGVGRLLVLVLPVQVGWASAMAASLLVDTPPQALIAAADALRPLAWSVLMLAMLWDPSRRTTIAAALGAAVLVAAAQWLAALDGADAPARHGWAVLAAVLGLTCVEQVFRNASPERRASIRHLCIALGAMAAFDLALHARALLTDDVDAGTWAARGYAHALVAPLVAVSVARLPDWRLGVHVSRKVVFHSATLLVSMAYLGAAALLADGLAPTSSEAGGLVRATAGFVALLSLVLLAASRRVRARLRVWVAKHFFSYRYDYRTEWLRLTELLARSDDTGGALSARALQGLADLVESPGGTLWLRADDGGWLCDARQAAPDRDPIAADDPLPVVLARTGWIVDVDEWRRHPERYGGIAPPPALADDADAWAVVPLVLDDAPIGFVQLRRPVAPVRLDWEVRDMLKAAGRQVAGCLAVREAVERLARGRQFESFNRMSAFVVHDLKNLVSQLALLLKNAPRHRDNPEFQRDMLETVENVIDRMQGLLLQLHVGRTGPEAIAALPVADALRAALAAKKGLRVDTVLDIDADVQHATVLAHRERLERVVGHLVQNAAEASPPGATVRVVAHRDGDAIAIDVIDRGRGMSRAFVGSRLFRPFSTTKDTGMGLGAFEAREYLREIGGDIAVASAEGLGTTFTVRLPLHAPDASAAGGSR